MNGDSQQRASCRDGVTWSFFAKIFERGERSRALLDFIEDNERFAFRYVLARFELECRDEPGDVIAEFKLFLHDCVVVEVDIGDI